LLTQLQTPLLPRGDVPKEAVEPEEAAGILYKILMSKGIEDKWEVLAPRGSGAVLVIVMK
jgi:hypothetical protein